MVFVSSHPAFAALEGTPAFDGDSDVKEVYDMGSRRELFLDGFMIYNSHNVILKLIRKNSWPIHCDIELEYEIPESSDALEETIKCVEYCRDILES